MADSSTKEKIAENLRDCGCDEKIIDEFLADVENGRQKQALELLAKHRQALLDQFHKCNKCIGCLDYLVFQMEKENNR